MGSLKTSYKPIESIEIQVHVFLQKEYGLLLKLRKDYANKLAEYPTKPMPRAPGQDEGSMTEEQVIEFNNLKALTKAYNKEIAEKRRELFKWYLDGINQISGLTLTVKDSVYISISEFAQVAILTTENTLDQKLLNSLETFMKGHKGKQARDQVKFMQRYGLILHPDQIPLYIHEDKLPRHAHDIYEVALHRVMQHLDIYNELELLKQFEFSDARQYWQVLKQLDDPIMRQRKRRLNK